MTGELAVSDLARMARAGMRALSCEQGLELFDVACDLGEAFVLPVRLDGATLRARASTGELPALLAELASPGALRTPTRSARAPVPLALHLDGVPEAERERVVLELVRSHAASVLGHAGIAAVGARRAFKELGFDSLASVELRNRLAAATGVQLAATVVFDHPTPVALSEHISGRVAESGARAPRTASAELDRLEQTLSAGSVGGAERTAIRVRLRTLLSSLAELDGAPGSIAAEDLDAATDEEMFELIDSELGGDGSGRRGLGGESGDTGSAPEGEERAGG
jgi:acyl carrier protein